MDFDNSRFEKNAQTTLGTIAKLHEKLKFKGVESGFKEIDKAASDVSLSGMANAIDSISSRFSTMGIVGMTVIHNLTNSIIDKVKNTVSTVTNLISEGGRNRALNIEQAKFQLEGLGVAWKDISGDINYGVKDTAYGLDSAAKVAAQLVASSVELGDPMKTALRSISGVAAMTNSTYDDIGRIFTTVAGNGRVMTEQLNQFSGRGLNAAATLRDYFNSSEENMIKFYELYTSTAKKSDEKVVKGAKATEANIRKMVTNGAISFEIFSDAMDKAYGEHAKEANKTYEGALSNVKAALSRIGADFQTPKLENLRNIFNSLIPVIDGVHAALKPVSDEFTKTTAVITKFATDTLDKFDGSALETFLKNISEVVGQWRESGGVTNALQSLVNIGALLKGIFTPIKDAFTDIFPPITVKNLSNISDGLLKFTEKLTVSDAASNNLKNTFKGLFTICKTLFDVIRIGFNVFGNFLKAIKPLGDIILNLTGKLGGMAFGLDEASDKADAFNKVFEWSSKIFEPLASGIGTFSKKVTEYFDNVYKKVGGLSGILKKIGSVTSQVFKGIIDAINNVFSSSGFEKVSDMINGGIFVYALDLFRRILIYIRKLSTKVTPFTDMFDQLRDTLFEYQRDLKATVLMKIAAAVALLAGSIILISNIESDKLIGASTAIITLFAGLVAAMKLMTKVEPGLKTIDAIKGLIQVRAIDEIATSIIKMAVAVLILSKAMENLAELEWSEIAKGLTAVVGLVMILTASAIAMSKFSGKASKGATGLILMSVAVSILSNSVKKISELSWEQIGKGLATMAGLMTILTTVSVVLSKKQKKLLEIGTGLLIMAAAIKVLSKSLSVMGEMNWTQVGIALVSLAASLGIITSAIFILTKNDKNLLKTGAGLLLIASSIKILAKALNILGSMSWEQMGIALISLAGSLAVISAAVLLMSKKQGSLIETGTGLLLIASSIKVLSSSLMSLGSMSWEQMGIALISLAGSLLAITVAINFMKGAIGGAAALLIISSALVVLAGALKIMGSMSWEQMGIALVTLAGSFIILGVAGAVLGPVLPVIIGLAAAVGLLGIGCLAAGAGVLAFSAGLLVLSAAGGAAVGVLTGLITTILNYLPMLGVKLAECLVMFAVTIAQAAPTISESVLVVLVAILNVLGNAIPMITGTIFAILSALIWQLTDFIPEVTDAGMQLLTGFIDGISSNIEELIDSAINLAINFVNGLANGIRDNQEEIFSAVKNLMGAVIEIMITALQTVASLIPGIGDSLSEKLEIAKMEVRNAFSSEEMSEIGSKAASGFAAGVSDEDKIPSAGTSIGSMFKDGLSRELSNVDSIGFDCSDSFENGLLGNLTDINSAGNVIGDNAVSGLSSVTSDFNVIGNKSGHGFASGIESKSNEANCAGSEIADSATDGVDTAKESFETVGSDSGSGFIRGIRSKLDEISTAGREIGKRALEAAKKALDSHSPSKKFDKLGQDSDKGFINGLIRLSGNVGEAASKVGKNALDKMRNVFAAVSNVIDDDIEYSPVISPVVDMSSVASSSNKINKMFNGISKINLSASVDRVNDISKHMNSRNEYDNDVVHKGDGGNVYNYTQNNYSPKSLSRYDIYRQTKNLFAMQKG